MTEHFTVEELIATFEPARFRTATFLEVVEHLPDVSAETASRFSAAHHNAVRRIADAHTVVTVETFRPQTTELSRTQWYSGDEAIIECCELDGEVIALTWPADEAVLLSRLALSIGLREEVLQGWELIDDANPRRVQISTDDVATLHSGVLAPSLVSEIGSVDSIIIMSSAVATAGAEGLSYRSTIVHTPTGAWLLDPGETPSLRQMHPVEMWNELALTLDGFGDDDLATSPDQ